MCGIAGVYYLKDSALAQESLLRQMVAIQRHRGPDGEGFYLDGPLGLGHCRLSIIDLSPAASQPMPNEDKQLWLTYNGEVYNYLELMAELKAKGHAFRSRSDSEVILHAYEEWGEDCVKRFNGMWAFALWDKRNKKLFCSRDRFGVKPFYYLYDGQAFLWASEIKALLAARPQERQPNYPYLYHFLTTALMDDGPETSFQNILSVPPAHSLTVGPGGLRLYRYWDYDESVRQRYDYQHPEETFRELLRDAVKLRLLRSDVPVGTCLSGGLDSSSVVALASGMIEAQVKTFSAIYDDPDCDESFFVRVVNERFNTVPHLVYPEPQDLFHLLPRIVWHQDEPTAGPGLYSQWHVMKVAQGRVKVLLDGQGGDELLAGYHGYFAHYLATLLANFLRKGQVSALVRLAQECPAVAELAGWGTLRSALKSYAPALARSLYRRWRGTEATTDIHPELKALADAHPVRRKPPMRFPEELNNMLYYALTSQSIPALLHYEDRNSMAFSLEARVPFLDYRLAEFCLGLPYDQKIRGATTKYILRRALNGILPPEVRDRRDKKGYPTPVARWFRDSQRQGVAEILFDARTRQRRVLAPAIIEAKFRAHCEGRHDYSWEIWRWLTTELWFRQFIDEFRATL